VEQLQKFLKKGSVINGIYTYLTGLIQMYECRVLNLGNFEAFWQCCLDNNEQLKIRRVHQKLHKRSLVLILVFFL
tara:strand:- start:484 stop:708 length:225 start_codon:yes stop_codon:yes gene_type:complete